MSCCNKRQFSIAKIMVLTCIAAVLIAVPRLTSGLRLQPTIIFWFVTLHQIAVASTIAFIVWTIFARKLSVAVLLALVILCLWGPNLAATLEYSLTGENTRSLALADAIGATPHLNWFYALTYDLIGYSYVPTR